MSKKDDKQFVVFNTSQNDGPMNTAPAFYPEGTSADERKAYMNSNKAIIGNAVGFKYNKLFMTIPGRNEEERKSVYFLKKEDCREYDDLRDYDVYGSAGIDITTDEFDTAIAFNVSGAPNVIIMDVEEMKAISVFCNGPVLDEKVLLDVVNVFDTDPKNLMVDVSPFDYEEPYYNPNDSEFTPGWIKNNEVWDGNLTRLENGTLNVNLLNVLMTQLRESGIDMDNVKLRGDSYFDRRYASTQRSRMENDPSQDGRNMHGVAIAPIDREYKQENIEDYNLQNYKRPKSR